MGYWFDWAWSGLCLVFVGLGWDGLRILEPIQLQVLLHGTTLSGGDSRAVARHFQNYMQSTFRFPNV